MINNRFKEVKTVPATNAPVPPAPPNQCDIEDITISVSLKDTEIFKRMIDVFNTLMDDKNTPDWIKEKIQRLVLNEFNKE